jgi:hypothetical protein
VWSGGQVWATVCICLLAVFFCCMGFAVVIDCRQPWHAELPCLLYRFCQGGGVHVVEQSRLVLYEYEYLISWDGRMGRRGFLHLT